MKICVKCKLGKDISEFHKQKTSSDGHRSICKYCRSNKDKEYRDANREKINEYMRNYSRENYDREKERGDRWRVDNRERFNERNRKYKKAKKYYIKYNKDYKHIWRMFLHTTLKRLNTKKELKTIEYLGYSPNDFRIRLESTFLEGMSWENYGMWHIDHIRPLSLFDIGTPISIVNSLDNIQALWAKDNLLKSDKY